MSVFNFLYVQGCGLQQWTALFPMLFDQENAESAVGTLSLKLRNERAGTQHATLKTQFAFPTLRFPFLLLFLFLQFEVFAQHAESSPHLQKTSK